MYFAARSQKGHFFWRGSGRRWDLGDAMLSEGIQGIIGDELVDLLGDRRLPRGLLGDRLDLLALRHHRLRTHLRLARHLFLHPLLPLAQTLFLYGLAVLHPMLVGLGI